MYRTCIKSKTLRLPYLHQYVKRTSVTNMSSKKTDEDCPKPFIGKQAEKLSGNMKNLVTVMSGTITKSPGLQQLAIGTAAGWCTGFLATRVGKTIAISVGGSIILISVANQIGFVSINWDRVEKKFDDTAKKIETTVERSTTKAQMLQYLRANRMFAAGFIGGLLIGIVS